MSRSDTKVRVAVTSRSFSRHPVLRAELLAKYPNVTFNDGGHALAGEALIAFLRGHERAITGLVSLDQVTDFDELVCHLNLLILHIHKRRHPPAQAFG